MTTFPYRYQGTQSVLLDWEVGRWLDVPPPPAVHSAAYRQLIMDVFLEFAKPRTHPSVLSLGCGNAMVEVELHNRGFNVLATDNAAVAVDLAAHKGLRSEVLDVLAPPSSPPPRPYDFVYADGLLGHVAILPEGLARLARTIRTVVADDGVIVLAHELSDGGTANYAVTGCATARFFRPPAGEMVRLLEPLLPNWAPQAPRIATYTRPGRGERCREILIFRRGMDRVAY